MRKVCNKAHTIFKKDNHINLYGASILAVIISIFNVGTAFILQRLSNIAIAMDMSKFWNLCKFGVLYFLLFAIVMYCSEVVKDRYIKKATKQYKDYIFLNCLKKNLNASNQETSATYISALTNDMEIIERDLFMGNIGIVAQGALFIFGIISMFCIDWVLMICVIVASTLPILISLMQGNKMSNLEQTISSKNSSFIHLIQNLYGGFSEIKSFRAENEIGQIFVDQSNQLENMKYKKRIKMGYVNTLSFICSAVAELLVCGVGVYLCVIGQTSFGSVIAFIQLVDFVVQPVQSIGPLLNRKKAAKGLIEKIENELEKNTERERTSILDTFEHEIKINDLSFYYEDKPILQHLTYTFQKGKCYAIVGNSGSGKTTLLRLLMGAYDNYKGSVRIDGKEIRDIKRNDLYKNLAIVQQNVFIFDDTIKANITMNKQFSDNTIQNAIIGSGLEQWVTERGLDYKCGENGKNLSGGEKQRLSIARALMMETPILFMDEATSALDVTTSKDINEKLVNMQGVTRIIITHKLDSQILKKFDSILVLKDGKIKESGCYDDLIRKQSYFYSMIQLTENK